MKNRILLTCLTAGLLFAGSALAVDATKFTIDKSHSYIGFSVKHMVLATVRGNFKEYDVVINYDAENIENSSVVATIKTASIDTDNERRDGHLRSDDFFNAEKFPEIKFVSKKIVKSEEGYIAVGDLTIRDVTKEVEVPFEIAGVIDSRRGKRMGLSAAFSINRKDYNVNWHRTLDSGGLVASDIVKIELEVEALHRSESGE